MKKIGWALFGGRIKLAVLVSVALSAVTLFLVSNHFFAAVTVLRQQQIALVCAGVIFAVGSVLLWRTRILLARPRKQLPGSDTTKRVDVADGVKLSKELGSIYVAMVSIIPFAVAYVVAQSPVASPQPQCANAQLKGVEYTAVTASGHTTPVYDGPGRDYPQLSVFAAGCSVGFDAFCIGEFLPRAAGSALFDSRWLRLPGAEHQFVAAAGLIPVSPDDALVYAGQDACSKAGGSAAPTRPELCRVAPASDGACASTQVLSAPPNQQASVTPKFSFAASDLVPAEIGASFVKPDQAPNRVDDQWDILNVGIIPGYPRSGSDSRPFGALTPAYVRLANPDEPSWLVAASCLAPGFPAIDPTRPYGDKDASISGLTIFTINGRTMVPTLTDNLQATPFRATPGSRTMNEVLVRAAKRACVPNI